MWIYPVKMWIYTVKMWIYPAKMWILPCRDVDILLTLPLVSLLFAGKNIRMGDSQSPQI